MSMVPQPQIANWSQTVSSANAVIILNNALADKENADAAAHTLSQRDVLVASDSRKSINNLMKELQMKFHSPWLSNAIPALTGWGADTSNLDKRTNPPTTTDFQQFFASEPQKSKMNNGMVFWSGTGIEPSQDFARSKGRNTLEMLIGDNWSHFQTDIDNGGYWQNWDAAVAGFWNLASEACAQASTGEVYVLMTPDREAAQQQSDPTRSTCGTCWYLKEKPALLTNSRVTLITKYLTTSNGNSVGQIRTMGDKIK